MTKLECGVCLEKYGPTDFIHCPDKHAFCKECVGESIKLSKSQGNPIWTCLQPHCQKEFEDAQLRKIFDERFLVQLYKSRGQVESKKSLNSKYQQCPECGWSQVVDNNSAVEFHCQPCNKTWCTICYTTHTGAVCPIVQKERRENAEGLARFVAAAMDKLLAKGCPRCKSRGISSDGCNYIICPCGNGWCYYCGQDLPMSERSSNAFHYNKSMNPKACNMWGGIDVVKRDFVKEEAIRTWNSLHPQV